MAPRLQAPERKRLILQAAQMLFAQNGFTGTSVRDIAKTAGISEALLYKHFPDKKHIYQETLGYLSDLTGVFKGGLDRLEPGSGTIVTYMYVMVRLILLEVPGLEEAQYCHERLLFRSLIEDTTFARNHLKSIMNFLQDRLAESLAKAIAADEILPGAVATENSLWFAHHLAMSLNLCHLSGESAFQYRGSKAELIHQALRFALRGMGMKETVIDEHLQPERLETLFYQLYE